MRDQQMENVLNLEKRRLRKRVDELDDQIMPLLAERFQLCRQLLELKESYQENLVDEDRRREIIEKAGGVYGDPEVQTYVMRVYAFMLNTSVDIYSRRKRSWWERIWSSASSKEQ